MEVNLLRVTAAYFDDSVGAALRQILCQINTEFFQCGQVGLDLRVDVTSLMHGLLARCALFVTFECLLCALAFDRGGLALVRQGDLVGHTSLLGVALLLGTT